MPNIKFQNNFRYLTYISRAEHTKLSLRGVPPSAGRRGSLKTERLLRPRRSRRLAMTPETKQVLRIHLNHLLARVLDIWAFVFRICFGFRISKFGFVSVFSLLPINLLKDPIGAGCQKPFGKTNTHVLRLIPRPCDSISDNLGTIQLGNHSLQIQMPAL